MIRVYFADGTHEDRDEASPAMPSGKGPPRVPGEAMVLRQCRPTPYTRCAIWAERDGQWVPAYAESHAEQTHREEAERMRAERDAEKARAGAAEKRLADLRAWAANELRVASLLAETTPEDWPRTRARREAQARAYETIVLHIDGKEGA